MDDKRTFFKGVACGVAVIVMCNFMFMGATHVYRSQTDAIMNPNKKVKEIHQVLDDNYIDEYDPQELSDSMYTGMVYGVGDPYTSYLSEEDLKTFYEDMEGQYTGIGVSITVDKEDNTIKIMEIFEGSPAQTAGLLPGDKIMAVDGIKVYGDAYQDAIAMMKGEPGTSVDLTILRESEDETFEKEVIREKIDVPTVTYEMMEDNIGYIRISAFDKITDEQFMVAYNDLTSKNMEGLVIDLRNNPGGSLDVVCNITDVLVPEGYITYTEDKNGKKKYIYSDENQIEVPLTVLVNGNSASASEVLSGAVKDMGVGELVGTTTYGKGLVQSLFTLSDGSALKVTIAKYYTPNGVCINGTGITPDYVVEMPEEKEYMINSLPPEEDPQLQKAIEVIENQID